MHAEFMRDDNGKIWFIFAKNTSVRKLDKQNEHVLYLLTWCAQYNKPAEEDNMPALQRVKSELTKNATRVGADMKGFYKTMKRNIGVNNVLAGPKSFTKTNDAFRRLRPKSPYSFTEIIDPSLSVKVARVHLGHMESLKILPSNKKVSKPRPTTAAS